MRPTEGLFAGRYTLGRVIGQGATATVHIARDERTGADVAIKLLRPELAQSAASDRFLKEIERTSALQHPRILAVLDSGEHNGQPFFVLPYMEGGTLRAKLKRERQLQIADAISIATQVAEALDYAHARGLIHRDIKPENILFSGGAAYVGDFGIARALQTAYGDTSTSSATIRGTPAYMSPEQAAGGEGLDQRSDEYSLACVVYEMIAGMPAFMGPTPESVMAQRFQHTPREIRVYRATAPTALDSVLLKAFAISRADRFASCGEFVAALTSAAHAVERPLAKPTSGRSTRWRTLLAASVLAIAAVAWRASAIRSLFSTAARTDTTRLALLPLDVAGAEPPLGADDLFRQGLERYRDLVVEDAYQVADAIRRQGRLSTEADAADVARILGAGRYVRGRLTKFDSAWRVSASLFDVESGRSLHHASAVVPANLSMATAAYARLADSLLLRGAPADSIPIAITGSRSLPAVQAFWQSQKALDDWDLRGADSALRVATNFDPDYARALVWLAQVRAWEGRGRASWGAFADHALSFSSQLNLRELNLARAIVLLSRGAFREACAIYDSLAVRNSSDFAAWYGRGQCRSVDPIVVADASSESGWRFRSGMQEAVDSYVRAFEILPSSHRGFEGGAYDRLRDLLFLSNRVVIGRGIADSAVFLGIPTWQGGKWTLVPYPWQRVAEGDSIGSKEGQARALLEQRRLFRRISSRWSALLPGRAGPKRAVSIALELVGDAAAIDTLRAARALTTDVGQRREVAARQAVLMLKYGVPSDTALLKGARALADSVLLGAATTPEAADQLEAVAALLGDCARLASLARQAAPLWAGVRASAKLIEESQTLLVTAALGCDLGEIQPRIDRVGAAIESEFSGSRAGERGVAFAQILLRPMLLSGSRNVTWLRRAAESGNDVARAALANAQGDTAAARKLLLKAAKPGRVMETPDMALASAHLWLALGDTAKALESLTIVERSRDFDINTLDDAANVAAFINATKLRAQLDRGSTGRRWQIVASILWKEKPQVAAVNSLRGRLAEH